MRSFFQNRIIKQQAPAGVKGQAGGTKTKTRAAARSAEGNKYTKTGATHTDAKGARRVVYERGASRFVRVKDPRTGKFRYKKI